MFSTFSSYLWNIVERLRHARAAVKSWLRDDGRYFCVSTLLHAILLLSLGLVQWKAIAHYVSEEQGREVAEFKPAEMERGEPPPVVHFERGKPQFEPGDLNEKTLEMFKDLPVGVESGERDLKPEDIGKPGGGTPDGVKNLISDFTGNIHGKSPNGPGTPWAGRLAGGWGTGKNPGSGGNDRGNGEGRRPPGATGPSERAVAAALNWLARHQASHGAWSLDHRKSCKGVACSGAGLFKSDAAATGLAILPFLAAGQTHKSKGLYSKHIGLGLAWLIKQQKFTGDLSGVANPNDPKPEINGKGMYAHAIATLALCEAYGMTKDDPKTHDEALGAAARKAVSYIERAQNESSGGWRYSPNYESDTSVFGWELMALKSAQLAEIPVDSGVLDRAKLWLNSVAKGEHLGLYSYQPYREVTPTMTAVGMLCRQYLGIDPQSASMLEGKGYLLQNLPDDMIGRNTYYWYYATLAMHNFNDADWDTWHRRMRKILIESQSTAGCSDGSWDPEQPSLDAWGQQGGRLMMTSLNALTLEVYYRYLPLFRTDSLLPKQRAAVAPEVPEIKEENREAN